MKHGVKRKKVRQEKSSEYRSRSDYKYKCRALISELDEVRRERRMIIYLDEINFTKLSLPKLEWSKKHSNLAVEQADVYQGYRSVLACMTEGHGIENLTIQPHAFNGDDFETYLKSMRRKHNTKPLALFMDQLSIHKTPTVKPWYRTLNITPIYNVGYSPEFNPIESVFSRVKFLFNKSRLNDIVNRRGFNFDRTIEAAFRGITVEHCKAVVRKSNTLLAKAC